MTRILTFALEDASRLSGIPAHRLRVAAKAGEVPVVFHRRQPYFPQRAFAEWVERQDVPVGNLPGGKAS